MDCEKFDRVVLDLLYEELDELTSAAAKRHMEHCSRCQGIGQRLRATREVGVLPLIEPPAGLQDRILAAEKNAHAHLPLRRRVGRGISMMASYAMRPQLAMAALFLLMIGASLLLIRVRPGERERVRVTERGVPESEGESVAIVPVPEKPTESDTPSAAQAHGAQLGSGRDRRSRSASDDEAPEPAAEAADKLAEKSKDQAGESADGGSSLYDQAMKNYRAGNYTDAQRDFDVVASAGGGNAASAALFSAQALRAASGCSPAAPRFESVGTRFRGTGVGNEASWQAADCYRSLGRTEDARRNYQALLEAPGYGDRAQLALAALDSDRVASRKSAAANAPAGAGKPPAVKAAPKPAAKPKATTEPKGDVNEAF